MTAATALAGAASATVATPGTLAVGLPLRQQLEREFRPRNDVARQLVQDGVRTLARTLLAQGGNEVDGDAAQVIRATIAHLDSTLSRQLNDIIHQPEFQRLEGSWRGLHHLVFGSQTSRQLKIRVLDVSKSELGRSLAAYRGETFDQSPLFKRVYDDEFGQFGGEPYGCLIGDYAFDHSMEDVNLLRGIARVVASAHCPFITAASPSMMQMESWSELANPRDLASILNTPEFAAWQALRKSSDARYVALTLPRFAARPTYGTGGETLAAFAFEEDLSRGAQAIVWSNAAYAMGVNVNRAFATYGWCSRIRGVESGGLVENLPMLQLRDRPGAVRLGIPTEIAISDRREAELSRAGFMPLIYRKNSNVAAFIGARTIHSPPDYGDESANENAELSARLPYVFAVSRFAHYLKCIGRDKVGSFQSREAIQRWFKAWIMRYVDGDPSISSEDVKARRPLAAAEVTVDEIAGEPGHYYTTFHLRPHYQLEGLTVSLRLVGRVPLANAESATGTAAGETGDAAAEEGPATAEAAPAAAAG